MDAKPTKGGRRPNAGRKPQDGATGLSGHRVSLDAPSATYLRKLGSGCLSVGIRAAARILSRIEP